MLGSVKVISFRKILSIILLSCCFGSVFSQELTQDSECYTANGRDYVGTQTTTYVKGADVYEPAVINPEVCLPWAQVRGYVNVTNFYKRLPNNYCRNPNNKLFPYCYVMRAGTPTFAYCHIPTCNTPALLGCFRLTVEKGGQASSALNVTGDVILSGVDSNVQDPKMKIGRCLNYCRSRKYDYAGVTGGDSCLCGKEGDDGARLKDKANKFHPHDCLQYPCADDAQQACGGDNAIAVYDVEAGECTPSPIHDRDSGIIYSPRWPGNYHHEAQCQWTIYIPDKYTKDEETKKNYQLKLHFTYFHLEKDNDTLKIFWYRNNTYSQSYGTYSGYKRNGIRPMYFSPTDTVAVHMIFKSDKEDKRRGFILKYDMIYVGPATTPSVSSTTTSTTTTAKLTTSKPTAATTTTAKSTEKGNIKPPTASGAPTATTVIPGDSSGADKNATLAKPSESKQEKTSSLSGGAVAGIVIGLLIFAILGIVGFFQVRKHILPPKTNAPEAFNNPVSFNNDTPL